MKMPQDCASEKVNGSLPEKSKPLMKASYKLLAHEAKMPEARFSKAPAILNREFQLDIWNKLSEHIVHIDGVTGSSPVATTNPKKS